MSKTTPFVSVTKGGFDGDLQDYVVSLDATPTNPLNTSGGVGQVTATVLTNDDTKFTLGGDLSVTTQFGSFPGSKVLSVDSTDGLSTLVADSILGKLVADYVMPPMTGTLWEIIEAYFTRAGVSVVGSAPAVTVAVPGWSGNMWEHLCQLLTAYNLEIEVTATGARVRAIRLLTLSGENLTTESVSISRQDAAKQVETTWYNHTWRTNGEFYPAYTDGTPTIYQVGAGESLVFTIQSNATLASVNQPVCVSSVAPGDYSGGNGVYSVAGADGNPITPAQWNSRGGSVKVRVVDEEPGTVEVTLTGMDDDSYAPYSLAMIGAVDAAVYNSLHLTGTGTFSSPESAVLETGSANALTGESVGAVVDNKFISTQSQAFDLGLRAAQSKDLSYTWSGSTPRVRRADYLPLTLPAVPGCRIKKDHNFFRVVSLNVDPAITALATTQDTTSADFDAELGAGFTTAQFDAIWAGRIASDFDLIPLWRG